MLTLTHTLALQQLTCDAVKDLYRAASCCGGESTAVGLDAAREVCAEAMLFSGCMRRTATRFASTAGAGHSNNAYLPDEAPPTEIRAFRTLDLPLPHDRNVMRGITDDEAFYTLANYGHMWTNGTYIFSSLGLQGGALGMEDAPAERTWASFSFDHGEGLFAGVVKYDRCTGDLLTYKDMRDMYAGYNGGVRATPTLWNPTSPYLPRDRAGKSHIYDFGPLTTTRGPLTQYGDHLYVYNGAIFRTAFAKVRKSDLGVVWLHEITDGHDPFLINGMWLKGMDVLPPRAGSVAPRVYLQSNAHSQYESYMNDDAWQLYKDRMKFHGALVAGEDRGTTFTETGRFSYAPTPLGDTLTTASFYPDVDFVRVWIPASEFAGQAASAGAPLAGAAMVPKWAGVHRVALNPEYTHEYVTNLDGRELSSGTVMGTSAVMGYVRLDAGESFGAATTHTLYEDYACTTPMARTRADGNWTYARLAGTDGLLNTTVFEAEAGGGTGVRVKASYLIDVDHPLTVTLYKSGAGAYQLSAAEKYALESWGGSPWFHKLAYRADTNEIYPSAGNGNHASLERQIRIVRASLARPAAEKPEWTDAAGMGLDGYVVPPELGAYGAEADLYYGSFTGSRLAREGAHGTTAWNYWYYVKQGLDQFVTEDMAAAYESLYETDATQDGPACSALVYPNDDCLKVDPARLPAYLETRRRYLRAQANVDRVHRTPRELRHMFATVASIDADTLQVHWIDQRHSYNGFQNRHHNTHSPLGEIAHPDTLSNQIALVRGVNADDAQGMTVCPASADGTVVGFSALRGTAGTVMAYNLSRTAATWVQPHDGADVDHGIDDSWSVPSLPGPGAAGAYALDTFDADGILKSTSPGHVITALGLMWGSIACSPSHAVMVWEETIVLSRRNQILFRNADTAGGWDLVERYPGMTAAQVKAQADVPAWAKEHLVDHEGAVHFAVHSFAAAPTRFLQHKVFSLPSLAHVWTIVLPLGPTNAFSATVSAPGTQVTLLQDHSVLTATASGKIAVVDLRTGAEREVRSDATGTELNLAGVTMDDGVMFYQPSVAHLNFGSFDLTGGAGLEDGRKVYMYNSI